MTTRTFTGIAQSSGSVVAHDASGVTYYDVNAYLEGLYVGGGVRVTIEVVPVIEQHECDKCKTAFNVDLRKSPPMCCGNIVPVVAVNDPKAPPAGGNWYWASALGRWRKMADDDIVFTNEEYERICKAVQPYSTDEDVGLQADQVIANVVARLASKGASPKFAIGELVRWDVYGLIHSGVVYRYGGSDIIFVTDMAGMGWELPTSRLTSAERPTQAPSLAPVASAPPPVPKNAEGGKMLTVPARCTKHDTAVKCRHCHLEEAHRRAFDGAYVGEGK